jgi:RHS repeat-associated protein
LAPDGQRTSVTETAGAQQTVITWDYDNLNRLVLEDYNAPGDTNDFLHDYVYDLVGNRTKKTVDASVVTTYSYNNADQLTQETTDGNSIVYTHDDNGALTFKDSDSDPNVTYGHNLRGRLAQVDIENGATVEYLYNPDGIRVRSVVDGNATDYVIDPHNHTGYAQVLKEVGDSNTVYVTGLDVLAQATGASDPKYLLYDGHGSVRALANTAGSIVERYNYESYGKLHNFAGTPSTNLLYSGEWRDQQTGLDNLRSRWYEPLTGRFNRMDELAGNNHDPQSLHKYLYCGANPVMNVDPSGRRMTVLEVTTAISIALFVTAGIHGIAHHGRRAREQAYEIAEATQAITYLGAGLQKQMARDQLMTSDPEALRFNMERWHSGAEMNKAVTLYNMKTENNLLNLIDTSYHGLEVAGLGLDVIGAGVGIGLFRSKILWGTNKLHSTADHTHTIVRNAVARQLDPDVKTIYVHKRLSDILGRPVAGTNFRADWAEVLVSGKINIFEVRSPAQRYNRLLQKGWQYKQVMGDRLNRFEILEVGQYLY